MSLCCLFSSISMHAFESIRGCRCSHRWHQKRRRAALCRNGIVSTEAAVHVLAGQTFAGFSRLRWAGVVVRIPARRGIVTPCRCPSTAAVRVVCRTELCAFWESALGAHHCEHPWQDARCGALPQSCLVQSVRWCGRFEGQDYARFYTLASGAVTQAKPRQR